MDCELVRAVDDEVRVDSASGGFVTTLLLHLLDEAEIDGAVVVRCQGSTPLIAESFVARTRDEILSARGSKYAPVSSCAAVREILKEPGRYAFVGTPCMLEGVEKLCAVYPALRKRIALKIGLVCAGMASRQSTKRYIVEEGGVDLEHVRRVAYRGGGWPGRFRVYGENDALLMDRPLIGGSLKEVVGVDHYLRCENCLDHWAHYADVVVSDPWSAAIVQTENKGRTAILLRTQRGREAIALLRTSGKTQHETISVHEMLSYNRHLQIDENHDRHGWMALYQVIFHGRLRYVPYLIRALFRRRLKGIRTTVAARIARRYYW